MTAGTKPTGQPRTDALFHELSEAHYSESPRERASRVELALVQLCAKFEEELCAALAALATEKRKTLELQRVYDDRGLQIAQLETVKTAPAITVESAIQSLVSALQADKGWLRDYADSILRKAIDRRPALTVDPETVAWLKPDGTLTTLYFPGIAKARNWQRLGRIVSVIQQSGEADRISPDESADYRRGWKDGYKHGAWASQPAAPHPLMDDKSLRAKAILDRVAEAPTPAAPDIEQLLKFYSASSLEQLVRAQAGHIAKLQEKLPLLPSLSLTFPRG